MIRCQFTDTRTHCFRSCVCLKARWVDVYVVFFSTAIQPPPQKNISYTLGCRFQSKLTQMMFKLQNSRVSMRRFERQGAEDPQSNFTGGFPVRLRVGEYQILRGGGGAAEVGVRRVDCSASAGRAGASPLTSTETKIGDRPGEARQPTDRCGWQRQLAPLRMLLVPPQTLCFQGCWLSVAANTVFLSSGVQGPVTVTKTATTLRYCNRKWIFFFLPARSPQSCLSC